MLINLIRMLSLIVLTWSGEVEAKTNSDSAEILCLAQNIYFEARGEAKEGKLAVAFVTLNRVNSNKFPNKICDVVKQARYSKWWKEVHNKDVPVRNRCQFSWYCDGVADDITDMKSWSEIVVIAVNVLNGKYIDNTSGALYYHSKEVNPWWNSHYSKTVVIGNHHFYAAL